MTNAKSTIYIENCCTSLRKRTKKFLSGPIIHVHVKLGQRQIGEEEKEEIHRIISQKGNLLVRSIESDVREEQPGLDFAKIELVKGMVRSGQTIQHDGNILFLWAM